MRQSLQAMYIRIRYTGYSVTVFAGYILIGYNVTLFDRTFAGYIEDTV